MRPLFIGPDEKQAIRRVLDYAETHKYSMADVYRLRSRPENAPGKIPDFVTVIPMGYRCVFTIEQQPPGWMRHISISVMRKGALPSQQAVAEIIKEFGFKKPLQRCHVQIMEETVDSVNVLELLKE